MIYTSNGLKEFCKTYFKHLRQTYIQKRLETGKFSKPTSEHRSVFSGEESHAFISEAHEGYEEIRKHFMNPKTDESSDYIQTIKS